MTGARVRYSCAVHCSQSMTPERISDMDMFCRMANGLHGRDPYGDTDEDARSRCKHFGNVLHSIDMPVCLCYVYNLLSRWPLARSIDDGSRESGTDLVILLLLLLSQNASTISDGCGVDDVVKVIIVSVAKI